MEDTAHVEAGPDEVEGDFGFVTLDRTHTLTSFEAYAKWAKALHFGLQYAKVWSQPSSYIIWLEEKAFSCKV